MSNSTLVTYTKLSPHCNKPRNHAIDTITIHCYVGQVTAKRGCDGFANILRMASCNYVVGYDGSIGLCVDEANRSWCSSNKENDHRAITIEVASDTKAPYAVTDKAYEALINLVADICKRNGIAGLKWKGDKSLVGKVDQQNMTVHRWFANKACPGDYLYGKMGDIAAKVNKILGINDAVKEKTPPAAIVKDDVVSIVEGATYYNGKSIPAWVKKKNWIVDSISGDRAVLGKSEDGKNNIQSAINVKYIAVVKSAYANSMLPYKVRVIESPVYIRKGAGTNTERVGVITDKGVYTIVEERNGFGKLKSNAGWVHLTSCKKL